MEKLKEELKLMQSNPRLYLANYFSDLKRDVILNNDFEQSIILESQIEVKSLIVFY